MRCRIEMNPVENLIDAHEQQITRVPFEDRQIIPRGALNQRRELLLRREPFDEI